MSEKVDPNLPEFIRFMKVTQGNFSWMPAAEGLVIVCNKTVDKDGETVILDEYERHVFPWVLFDKIFKRPIFNALRREVKQEIVSKTGEIMS